MASFQPSHILVFGATGNVGKNITNSLVNAQPTFPKISIFTSESTARSKSELINGWKSAGISVIIGDIANPSDVTAAYQGVDTVISSLGRAALEGQMELIRLAEASPTVRWFFPSEFGTDPEHNEQSAEEKPHQTKLAVRKFIRDITKQLNVTYIVVGPYFDMWVDQGKWNDGLGGFDVIKKDAILTGDGETKIGFTTLRDAGTAVVAALRHPEASLNKVVRVASFVATSNQVLSEYEKQLGAKLRVKYVSLVDHGVVERKMWEEGNPWGTVATLRRIWATGGAMYDDGLANGSIGLGDDNLDSLEAAVRKHISIYQ
ncbi:isoflavone reductase family [Trichoderma arundinaceum]|uniref:Isoflavone reductase family n=1 Tax=Trichoderma arundinaceum TaxID=490622 RepID=A0A395NYU6_TRIAR|nr:isoflavone reductase family [Trichoderma arundinaceum]